MRYFAIISAILIFISCNESNSDQVVVTPEELSAETEPLKFVDVNKTWQGDDDLCGLYASLNAILHAGHGADVETVRQQLFSITTVAMYAREIIPEYFKKYRTYPYPPYLILHYPRSRKNDPEHGPIQFIYDHLDQDSAIIIDVFNSYLRSGHVYNIYDMIDNRDGSLTIWVANSDDSITGLVEHTMFFNGVYWELDNGYEINFVTALKALTI